MTTANETTRFHFTDEMDVHTSDLTAACMKSVQLRHEGKILGQYTTALYRGQLAGMVCSYIHDHDAWSEDGLEAAITWGLTEVERTATDENRPVSDSVRKNLDTITGDVRKVCGHYIERLAGYFAKCKLIGTEVPVRMEMEIPGQAPMQFASHVDLMFRDAHNQLCIWDFKHQQESPTMAYLGRNLQFVCYYLSAAYGHFQIDSELDLWHAYGEFPDMAWVDLANFKPYSRKTEAKDPETGELRTFVKGEARPLQNILRRWTFSPDRENDMRKELALRVTMLRHGLFPTNPDKLGCHLCESNEHCPAFHRDGGHYENQ